MVYGFLLTYVVAVINKQPDVMRLSLKAFLAGSFFSAVWAMVEFVCKLSGVEYPAFLFNTGTAGSTMGYKQVLAENVFRVSSVAVEPSIFAQALLVAVSIYLPYVLGKGWLFGRRADRAMFLLMVLVLFLTTSATAYVGIVFGAFVVFALLTTKGLFKVAYIVFAGALLALLALLYASVSAVQVTLASALLSKGESGSALERLMTIQHSWEMFTKYPVLGIGWESIVSHDLIVHILANSGVVGFVCFSAAAYALFRALYRSFRKRQLPSHKSIGQFVRMDVGLYVAFAITLFTSILSGFLNVFSFFWFTWGLAIAVLDVDLDRLFEVRAPGVTESRRAAVTLPRVATRGIA
jgi:O-antigen ligase